MLYPTLLGINIYVQFYFYLKYLFKKKVKSNFNNLTCLTNCEFISVNTYRVNI